MKDRIIKIINKEQLSSSKFADIVGVQRSSVSHILSGRNKPSLDFIQKILLEFKTINSEWLLFGTGDMYKKEAMPSLFDKPEPIKTQTALFDTEKTVVQKNNETPKQTEPINLVNHEKTNEPEKKITLEKDKDNDFQVKETVLSEKVSNLESNNITENKNENNTKENTKQEIEKTEKKEQLQTKTEKVLIFFNDYTFKEYTPA